MTPKATTAGAMVFHGPGRPMRWETFRLDEPRGGEVLARIRCATICGSDLHSRFGRRPSPVPGVLGHEMVGEVAAIGPSGAGAIDGSPLAPGDRITWSMVWSCGVCFYCTRGLQPKCERLMKFGHEPLSDGRALTGGFAEYCLLPPGTAILRIPGSVPDLVASPANCATATVAAVFREAGSVSGECVVVIGAGMLGLTACAMASAHGAARVLVVETDPARTSLALSFGAGLALSGNEPAGELRERVLALTEGRGAGIALDFSGSPEAMETAWQLLRPGGRLILAGATFPARPIAIPAEQVVRRMLRMAGVYNYAPRDLAAALDFLATSGARFPFLSLVGKTFPLSRIEDAFEYAETQRPPRVALLPEEPA